MFFPMAFLRSKVPHSSSIDNHVLSELLWKLFQVNPAQLIKLVYNSDFYGNYGTYNHLVGGFNPSEKY